jgi:molybdopterin converting factor small subunit
MGAKRNSVRKDSVTDNTTTITLDAQQGFEDDDTVSIQTSVNMDTTSETHDVTSDLKHTSSTYQSELLLARLQEIHQEQIREAADRERQLQALVQTLEKNVDEQHQHIQRLLNDNKRINQQNDTLINAVKEKTEQIIKMHDNIRLFDVKQQQREEEMKIELDKLQKDKETLIYRFYHHAFLAVKLKLQDVVSFDINEMVEQAVAEKVSDRDINVWLATKLGFEKR